MKEGSLTIINQRGLHARAADKLARLCLQYRSTVRIGHPERMVDGKNIMALLMLAAAKGTTLHAQIQGEDAEAAYNAISDLFACRFGEDE
ncbi:MAG: hypothetical protein RL217_2137 [Pseudomonadota bacterium]|jgi:phosphotransferase system HPr (HPr) family protein